MAKHKKSRRKMKNRNGQWQLTGRKNRHHDKNRVNGGGDEPRNIFHWDTAAHAAWHFLFKNLSILEASNWLRRIHDENMIGVKLDIMNVDEQIVVHSPS